MKYFIFFFTIFSFIFPFFKLQSQGCCSISINSFGSTESSPLNKGSFQIGLSYWYINSSAFYSLSNKVQDPLNRNAIGKNLIFDFEYGFLENLSVYVSIPLNYFYRKNNIFDTTTILKNSGLGDLFALFKFNLFSNVSNGITVASGLGIKLPTGNNSVESNGVELPIDLQTGTGSFDFTFWSLFMISISDGLFATNSVYLKISTTNSKGYKIGNELNINSSYFHNIFQEILFLNLMIRFQKRWKDIVYDQIVINSGRYLLEILPGFIIKYYPLNIRLNVGFPLYTRVDGKQLSLLSRFGVELRYIIF